MPPRPRMIGFRRVTSASPCDFCAMLASRGANYVYRSERVAEFEAHDNCSCSAEPVWRRGQEPPEIVALREEFERVTAGIGGTRERLIAWRRHWRQRGSAVRTGADPGMTVVELRALAKAQGVTGYSRMRKQELLDALGAKKPAAARKTSAPAKAAKAAKAPGARRVSSRHPAVDALPRTPKAESAGAAARATNPHHGTTRAGPKYRDAPQVGQSKRWDHSMGPPASGAFEENCTNVVMAFEMRMRGYDVTAAPLHILDRYGYAAGRTLGEYEELLLAWRLPNGRPHGRSFKTQKWLTDDELRAVVESWPEGARGIVHAGRHTFIVMKVNGKMRFIEAQEGPASGAATAKYLRRYGSRTSGAWKVIRIDDLEPTDAILEAVVPA